MKRCLLVLAACGGAPAPAPRPAPVAPPPVSAAPAPAGHPADGLIPRAVLFGNPERMRVEISPDGAHLAWLAPRDGVMNIWVAPVDHADRATPVTAETTRPIRRYGWTLDGTHLFYFQDQGGDENYHLFRADLDGTTKDLTPVPGARVDLLGLSEKQPGTIAVTMNDRDPKAMDAYMVDVDTGTRTLLVKNELGLSDITLDPQLRPALARMPNPDGTTSLLRWDGKAFRPFETIPFEDAETTRVVGLSTSGKVAYLIDSRGRDTAALVELDLATRKQRVLAEDPKADVDDVLMHARTHRPRAAAFDPGRQRWVAVEKALEDDLDGLRALPEHGDLRVTSMTLDDHYWVVESSSPQHPGHIYLWDHRKHHATFLFAAQPALDQQPLAAMETVTIPAHDGLSLVGYLTKPATAAGPVPMVLFVHGGPWARDAWRFDPVVQLLANRGYAVLQVNFRASTGFGKAFLNAGNLQWGKAMHTDLLDAVAWAIAAGVTTRDQVAIMGGSYGGYAALAGLAFTPDVFRCGLDMAGPANLITLLQSVPPYWAPEVAMFKKRVGDWTTPEGQAQLAAASPLTKAADIRRPLLIGQGANDPRVKNAEPEQIVAAMKQHGLPVTYLTFPDEGHGLGRPENMIAFLAATEAFLSVYLGGVYQPVTEAELKASSMHVTEGQVPGFTAR